jgi:hypothetical protein
METKTVQNCLIVAAQADSDIPPGYHVEQLGEP